MVPLDEFSQRYDWHNDPEKVRLCGNLRIASPFPLRPPVRKFVSIRARSWFYKENGAGIGWPIARAVWRLALIAKQVTS